MTKNELIQQILALPSSEQQEIVDVVLARLGDGLPPQLNPQEQEEILRRSEEYEKHPERFLSWEQVQAKLDEQRARRGN